MVVWEHLVSQPDNQASHPEGLPMVTGCLKKAHKGKLIKQIWVYCWTPDWAEWKKPLIGKSEGSIFRYLFVCCLFVGCNAGLTRMLLWPLKKLESFHLSLVRRLIIQMIQIWQMMQIIQMIQMIQIIQLIQMILFCYCSATFPLLSCNFSATFLILFRYFSATFPLLFWHFSATFPLLIQYLSATFPILFCYPIRYLSATFL